MIPTYAQIENAWREVRRGKTALDRYQRYEYYLDDHIYKIRQQLASPDFKPLPMGLIRIDVPKPRIAQVPTVRDKIIMHALCDNTIYPAVASRLGDGISACLIRRGTEYGTARLTKLLRDSQRRHSFLFRFRLTGASGSAGRGGYHRPGYSADQQGVYPI